MAKDEKPTPLTGHKGTGAITWGSSSSSWAPDVRATTPSTGTWSVPAATFTLPSSKGWSGNGVFEANRQRTEGSDRGYTPGWNQQGVSYFSDAYYNRAGLSDLVAKWQQKEAERLGLNTWTEVQGGSSADVGKVYRGSAIGQFSQYPGVDDEIQKAAQAWGIPTNFLKAVIAHESSGDWETNNYVNTNARPEMGELLPYVGVFKVAADSRGLSDLYQQARTGNRGAQINLLAAVLASQAKDVLKKNPAYGWLNVAAYHYSGDPSGNSTPSDSYQYGTAQQYMANVESWWKMMDTESGNTWNNTIRSGGGTTAPGMSSIGGNWSQVDQWSSQIASAIQRVKAETGVDVPGNVVKALMKIESNGDPNVGVSPHGYGGLMQTGAGSMGWDGSWSVADLNDPTFAIYTGVKELALRYQHSGKLPWENVVVGYFSGHYYPNGASDGYNSDYNYQKMFIDNMNALGAAPQTGGSWTGQPGGSGVAGIWGSNGIPTISQELGPTEWSQGAGAWMYGYASAYGVEGHTGIDYSMNLGGMLYAPASGTVEIAGGTPYFTDERYGATPGTGELYIRLDNGDVLILGHMQHIGVNVGDRVTAGTYVGQSGTYNGGHVHVEYRTPDPSTDSGWRIVDPRTYLGNTQWSTGSPVTVTTGQSPRQAMSYQEMVRAIALGEPVYTTGGLTDDTLGTGWRGYLRDYALGNDTSWRTQQSQYLWS